MFFIGDIENWPPNYFAGVGAGRTSEFIEMKQVGGSDFLGSAWLWVR